MATYTQTELRAAQNQLDTGALAPYDLEVAADYGVNSAETTEILRHVIDKFDGYTAGAKLVSPLAAVRTYSSVACSGFAHTTTGTATITMSGALGAYEGPQTFTLSSSDEAVSTVPATATVAVGASTGTFTVTGVSAGSVTVTAVAVGLGTSHNTGAITVS